MPIHSFRCIDRRTLPKSLSSRSPVITVARALRELRANSGVLLCIASDPGDSERASWEAARRGVRHAETKALIAPMWAA